MAQQTPQGVTLTINANLGIPFKALISQPNIEPETLMRMYDELVAEIQKRGMKI